MSRLTQLAMAWVTLSSIADASLLERRGQFSVKQILNPNYMPNGTNAYTKAFFKFSKPMPHTLAAAIGNDGSVTATPPDSLDSEYLCPVDIDGQTFQLDFDTGSSDLCVFFNLRTSPVSAINKINPGGCFRLASRPQNKRVIPCSILRSRRTSRF